MLTAQELRLGNYVEYFIEDPFDKRKNWWNLTQIYAQDIASIDYYSDPSGYRPILITEEWLLKLGFENQGNNRFWLAPIYLLKYDDDQDGCVYLANQRHVNIFCVHELQNLYFALTGRELTIKQQTNG